MSFPVPDACTLPAVDRPVRLAEFDELFATAVRRVEPVTARHVRLHLSGPAGLRAAVEDLTARESRCCSFFGFATTVLDSADGEAVVLDIEVPGGYADVLASLAERAAGVSSGSAG